MDCISDDELIRIIDFLAHIRIPYEEKLRGTDPDPVWNMMLFLMKSHVHGEVVTKSCLASVSRTPFASAMRRIHRMIEDGYIEQHSRKGAGKSLCLVPSQKLKSEFITYAKEIKALLAETFGLRRDSAEDYYFGGSNLAGKILPPLETMENSFEPLRSLRFLLHDDNYFESMRNLWSDFRSKLSSRRNFSLLSLPELHKELLKNADRKESDYDVVCVNAPWLGEMAKAKVIQPLGQFLDGKPNLMDLSPNIWRSGHWQGEQYGIPIYSTIETLAIRKDIFAAQELQAPVILEDVIKVAKRLHQPKQGMTGIVWNAAQGMSIAHSFMFFMGCCGQPILSVPMSWPTFDYSDLKGEMYRPKVMSEAGMRALDYMRRLLAVSPPDILIMDWNRALDYFMLGHAAMIYCWTMRAVRFECDPRSAVKRKVEYLPHPPISGLHAVSPVGGFLLAIPSGLSPERSKLAFEAISWMVSPSAMQENIKFGNGVPVAPRFSLPAAPGAVAPILRFADRLVKQNKLRPWLRPPIPEYAVIEHILGEEVYAALNNQITDKQALERSQDRIDKVMRTAGHY